MYAIVLEPEEELAARLGAEPVELGVTHFVHLEDEQANQLALFQYMIGNTDWNVNNLHNLITMKLPEVRKLTPIPYDFDYSGLVNAPYAVPHESLPISNVRDRYHKGQVMTEEELEPLIEKFKAFRPEFIAACEDLKKIDQKAGEESLKYLSYFLDMLDKPKAMVQVFVKGRQ